MAVLLTLMVMEVLQVQVLDREQEQVKALVVLWVPEELLEDQPLLDLDQAQAKVADQLMLMVEMPQGLDQALELVKVQEELKELLVETLALDLALVQAKVADQPALMETEALLVKVQDQVQVLVLVLAAELV